MSFWILFDRYLPCVLVSAEDSVNFFLCNHEGWRLDRYGCGQHPHNVLLNLISFQGRREGDFFSLSSEKKEHVGCVFPNMRSLYIFGHMPITLEFELLESKGFQTNG